MNKTAFLMVPKAEKATEKTFFGFLAIITEDALIIYRPVRDEG
jgi:hypothetical protein